MTETTPSGRFVAGKPKTGGRQKGSRNKASKPRNPIERLARRRERRDAALDQLYEKDPERALELEAQLYRDDVAALRHEAIDDPTEKRVNRAQIEAAARAAGPISDEDAMRTYLRMVRGGDDEELALLREQLAIEALQNLYARADRCATEFLRNLPALRLAVAAGQFKPCAEVNGTELLAVLAVPAQTSAPAPSADQSQRELPVPIDEEPELEEEELEHLSERESEALRHSGIPLERGSSTRYIPRTPNPLRQAPHGEFKPRLPMRPAIGHEPPQLEEPAELTQEEQWQRDGDLRADPQYMRRVLQRR
jgi:hypothetical protein